MRTRTLVVIAVVGVLIVYALSTGNRTTSTARPARLVSTTRFAIPGDFPPSIIRIAGGDLVISGNDSGRLKRGEPRRAFLARRASTGGAVWHRWLDGRPGRTLAVAPSQEIYTVNSTLGPSGALSLSRFDRSGRAMWTRVIDRRSTMPRAVAFGRKGEVVIVGSVGNRPGEPYVVKCNTNGKKLWSRQIRIPGTSRFSEALDVSVDGSDHVYVTGATGIEPTRMASGFITKLDGAGRTVWLKQFDGRDTYGAHISLDGRGHLVVAGASGVIEPNSGGRGIGDVLRGFWSRGEYRLHRRRSGISDAFVAMYDTNGNQRWLSVIATPQRDSIGAIAVGTHGECYTVIGRYAGRMGNGPCVRVDLVKYGADGRRLWTQPLGLHRDERACGLFIDGKGGIFVAGWRLANRNPGHKAFVVRLEEPGP